MTNAITTAEMYEQFGDVPLVFDLYANKYFVLHGSSHEIDISLMIHNSIVYELHANQSQAINHYASVLSDEVMNKFIKIRISHNFSNIYQN